MKIEAGKYYRTRAGKKAFVLGVSPFDSTLYVGTIRLPSNPIGWDIEGRTSGHYPTVYDLVEEWREPLTKTITLYLLQSIDKGSILIEKYDKSIGSSLYRFLGKKKVTITEGDK